MAAETVTGGENSGDVRQSYRAVKEDVRELGRDVGHLAQAARAHAAERAHDLTDMLRAKGDDALASLQAQVREKPGMALGIAAGAGLLLGLIMARR